MNRAGAQRGRRMAACGIGLLACALGIRVVAGQTAPLALVSTEWPPFTNVVGQPRIALDLVEEALRRSGLAAKTTIVTPAEFTPALLSGAFDGSAAAWKDPQRERELLFSQPYFENRLVLVGRHGADVSATTLAVLVGRRVAIVEGYSYGDAIEASGASLVRSRDEQDSLTRLLAGDVDYTLMDDLVVQYLIDNYPEQAAARLAIGRTPLVIRPLHFAVRRSRLDAASIINGFNEQVRGMMADRTYHRLLHVDWIRADVDGDGVAEYIPQSDHVGRSAPLHVYSLFSTQAPTVAPTRTPSAPGFYVGGTLYSDWASVPDRYKEVNPDFPDPSRSAASLFQFKW